MTTPATPNESNLLVHAYLDGALDTVHAVEMERRLAADPALAAKRDRIAALRSAIKEQLPPEPAPEDLVTAAKYIGGVRPEPVRPSWQALAAAVILAAAISGGTTWLVLRPNPAEVPAELIVASHVRALMAPQPIDVSSSDRHTVKPWFSGRIPQAPRVVDLTDKGFPLVGGRIDVFGVQPVPTLVYRHRQHLISLIAAPVVSGAPPSARRTIAGYNLLSWRDDNTEYWAVSDLGLADLEAFAAAFRDPGADR